MKQFVGLVFIFFFSIQGYSQIYDWHHSMGGKNWDAGTDIVLADSSSQIVVGTYTDTVDFDPGPGVFELHSRATTAFVAKYDSLGNFQWVKHLLPDTSSNGNSSRVSSVCIDDQDNILITGRYDGTVDFDPGSLQYNLSSTSNSHDLYILKLDKYGDFIWVKDIGNNTIQEEVSDISVNSNDEIFICGKFTDSLDFDPGIGVHKVYGALDMFLLKLDQNGLFQWVIVQGGSSIEFAQNVSFDSNDNILLSGYIRSDTDFDPSPGVFMVNTIGSNPHGFIQKLTPAGNLIWVYAFKTNYVEIKHVTDVNDNIYLSGPFGGGEDFNPGIGIDSLYSNGIYPDVFVLKMDSSGVFEWAQSFGGVSSETYTDLSINLKGEIFVSTSSGEAADYDSSEVIQMNSYNGGADITLFKLDTAGFFYWVRSYGGAGQEYARITSNEESIFITGYFESIVDFNPNAGIDTSRSLGNKEAYILKLDIDSCMNILLNVDSVSGVTCNDSGYVSVSAFNSKSPYSYLWNTVPVVYDSSVVLGPQGKYLCLVSDDKGCTREFEIEVNTIYKLSTEDTLYICQGDSSLILGDYRTEPGLYNDTIPTPLVCDSIFSTRLIVWPAFYDTTHLSICEGDSIVIFGQYQSIKGTYYDSLQTIHGCDSFDIIVLSLDSSFYNVDTTFACQGDSTLIFGQYQSSSGLYYDSLQTVLGCDSVLATQLIINSLPAVAFPPLNPDSICQYELPYTLSGGTPAGGNYSGFGVTGNVFMPSLVPGSYHMTYTYVDSNNCVNSDSTILHLYICAGIDGVGSLEVASIFPNPTAGQLNINLTSSITSRVTIYNILGELITSKQFNKSEFSIDIPGPPGLYLIQIETDSGMITRRVVKE